VGPAGQGGPARGERSRRRCGRPGVAGPAVPRSRRGRHLGNRRRRRRRALEPPAPGHPRRRGRRPAEGRERSRVRRRPEPRRHRRDLRDALRQRERRRPRRTVRSVVDASDNFPTRFLVSDACTVAGVPFFHGAVYRFEGQVTTFSGEGPCYRCLFPQAPPEGTVPDCSTAGVLGVLPGTVGCLQATEVVKWIVGEGESLEGACSPSTPRRCRSTRCPSTATSTVLSAVTTPASTRSVASPTRAAARSRTERVVSARFGSESETSCRSVSSDRN